MRIKDHYLYPIYVEYLKNKNLTKGELGLSMISESMFFDFKFKYDIEDGFKDEQDSMYKVVQRDNKIDQTLNDDISN